MKTQAPRLQNILHCFLKLLAGTFPANPPVVQHGIAKAKQAHECGGVISFIRYYR